ncbi:hypothetical protein BDN72DRAFT_835844 [Pluteus cervinus]|uniref:Uncharacterized protein n=1 Tax=Pluteus cervinus TaxID=181527 RepID=A0ACD3B4M1_9AGAR|nr:hypothetical protein BDN72DRAFT_835844 [Pluteus cervinus]
MRRVNSGHLVQFATPTFTPLFSPPTTPGHLGMGRKKRARTTKAPAAKRATCARPGVDYFTKLPAELLTEIAKYAHVDIIRQVDHPVPNLAAPHYLKPVLVLAAISRRLRSIITGESSFWSYIRIDARTTREEAVAACLERSKNHPLTILLIGDNDTEPPLFLLEDLIEHLHRWVSFSVMAPTTRYLRFLFGEWRLARRDAPILKKIYVAKTSEDVEEGNFSDDLFKMKFSSIQHVQLSLYPFQSNDTMTTLTRLEVDAPLNGGEFTFAKLASVARDLVHLEYLNVQNALNFDRDDELGLAEEGSIIWPSLLELVVWGENTAEGFIWRYLKLFKAPKLQKFVSISPDTKDFKTDNINASQIAANMPRVQEVTLLCPHVEGDAGQKLFIFFPQVTHLTLCYYTCDGNKPSFNSFFYPEGLSDTKIWPNLKSVSLDIEAEEEALLRSVLDCLQRRGKDGRGIAKIIIPPGELQKARELEVVGAEVCLADIPDFSHYGLGPG